MLKVEWFLSRTGKWKGNPKGVDETCQCERGFIDFGRGTIGILDFHGQTIKKTNQMVLKKIWFKVRIFQKQSDLSSYLPKNEQKRS